MKGSCLCQAIAYEIDQLDGPIVNCSCRTCRKAHGAAFPATARVLHEHFRWLKGEQHLRAFASSPDKDRLFCSQCGTHLVAQRAGQPSVILRVATLDEDPGRSPEIHIWRSHEVPWAAYGEGVVGHPEVPSLAG